jgi:hypothetical protein
VSLQSLLGLFCVFNRLVGITNAACGVRLAACGVRLAACGLRLAACGVRLAACGLRLAACCLLLATCCLLLGVCGQAFGVVVHCVTTERENWLLHYQADDAGGEGVGGAGAKLQAKRSCFLAYVSPIHYNVVAVPAPEEAPSS